MTDYEINDFVIVNEGALMYTPAYLEEVGIADPIGRITDIYPGRGDEMYKVTFQLDTERTHSEVYYRWELDPDPTGRIYNDPSHYATDLFNHFGVELGDT